MMGSQAEKHPFWVIPEPTAAWIGGAIWLAALLVIRPSPFDVAWARLLLLFAPLVLVPLAFRLVALSTGTADTDPLWRVIRGLQLPAAVSLSGAFLLPQGLAAAALTVPWVATTSLMALFGLIRIGRRPVAPLHELCLNAALVLVVVGIGWAFLDRYGARPLDFEPVIVLLTAIHFHYAGFVLPLVTAFAIRQLIGRVAQLAGFTVLLGVPLVAAGITTSQLGWGPWLECSAAWLMATAGLLVSGLHLRLVLHQVGSIQTRWLWTVAAVSLAASMILAALYGSRFFLPIPGLDIPWMRALHGSANALGFGFASLLAWLGMHLAPMTEAGGQFAAASTRAVCGADRRP
jgi:hypothetical protein